MPLEEENARAVATADSRPWLAWYRGLIAGLTAITVSLLAYFGSATLDELKAIRAQQIAFGQSLAVAASHVEASRADIGKLWDRNEVTDTRLNEIDRRTSFLEYRLPRIPGGAAVTSLIQRKDKLWATP